jgi:asparagine synthase (glutamine-hydrolysing)
VLVHLYEEYGDDMVHALEGMYALALWDRRRRRLLLARDRFGEKPLFYTRLGSALVFASELTALCEGIPTRPDIDATAMEAYFILGYVPGPATMLAGVRQLAPGELLCWEHATDRLISSRYWRPVKPAATVSASVDELATETHRLLDTSVQSRMIADVPLGVLLSGGVDSTLVAALSASHSNCPIKTFTVGYEVEHVSETKAARRCAEVIGSDHREIVLSDADVAERVPRVLRAMDQPLADQALIPNHAVAELARGEVTVAIGGEGADEVFGGYPRYRWLTHAEKLHRVVPASAMSTAHAALCQLPLKGRLRRLRDLTAPCSALERNVQWVTEGRAGLSPSLFGPALAGGASRRVMRGGLASLLETCSDVGVCDGLMLLDQESWLPDDVLVKTDRASMMVSLEVRTPYLNRELTEFATSVPGDLHRRGGGKLLLRSVLAKVLPAAAQRRKAGWLAPASEWLRGPLAPILDTQVRRGCLFSEGWFDRAQVAACVRQHAAGTHELSSPLWALLALGLWLDRFRGHEAS